MTLSRSHDPMNYDQTTGELSGLHVKVVENEPTYAFSDPTRAPVWQTAALGVSPTSYTSTVTSILFWCGQWSHCWRGWRVRRLPHSR